VRSLYPYHIINLLFIIAYYCGSAFAAAEAAPIK